MTRRETKKVLGGFVFALVFSLPAGAQFSGPPSWSQGPRPVANTEARRDFYFTGKVMMEDGTAPPEPVTVEIVCGTGRTQQTLTDTKGKFSFRIGDRQGGMTDVSSGAGDQDMYGRTRNNPQQQRTSSPLSRTPVASANSLLGCDLHVTLAGYRSDDLNLSQHRSMDNPDVGTMILHRIAGVSGTAVSLNSLNAPKEARKEYDKGGRALKEMHSDKAQEHFAKAVGLYPKYSTAWYHLGVILFQQKKLEEARTAFAKAIDADPSFVLPYLASAQLALQQKRWAEVVEETEKLIALDPLDFPQAYLMQAMAQGGLRNLDAAEKSAREAIRLDTGHRFPRTEYVLGFVLARKHDYASAAKHMHLYLDRSPNAPDADAVRLEIAQLEKAAGAISEAVARP